MTEFQRKPALRMQLFRNEIGVADTFDVNLDRP